MISELYYNEILKTVPKDIESNCYGFTLPLINKYVTPKILTDEMGNLRYEVDNDELKSSDISNEELIELVSNGWGWNEDKTKVIKKLNY